MEVSIVGQKLIKKWESLRLESYRDIRGTWTIGWGSTGRGNYPHRITSVQAEKFFRQDLESVAGALNQMITTDVSQSEFDALASWVFNIGPTKAKTSTLIRKLNAGAERSQVAIQFLRWCWATLESGEKVKVKGLVNRREAERQLFLSELFGK